MLRLCSDRRVALFIIDTSLSKVETQLFAAAEPGMVGEKGNQAPTEAA